MCQNKLQQLLLQKEHCKEGKCRIEIDLEDVEIFDTENEKGRQILKKYGYIKYCDCIIFIKKYNMLLVIEILCGSLNENELTDKEKQVSTWKRVLQNEELKSFFSPEFRNRLDSIVKFNPLDENILIKIVTKFIKDLENALKTKVREVMTRKVIVAKPDMTINDAAKLMVENNIKRLPVVDDEGNLIGIVTRGDLIEGLI